MNQKASRTVATLKDLIARIESGEVFVVEARALDALMESIDEGGKWRTYERTGRQEYTIIVQAKA